MKKCVVCRSEITSEEPAILFIDNGNMNKEICSECENQMDIMQNSENTIENIEKNKSVINYLYTCCMSNNDIEVVKFLRKRIEDKANDIIKMQKEETECDKIDTTNKLDYFADLDNNIKNDESLWKLSICKNVLIVIIVLIGLILSYELSFISFVIAAVISYMLHLFIESYITMSQNVLDIKKAINKKH